jgi:peptidoglycan/LPS O-acetylase OafA/YrhL
MSNSPGGSSKRIPSLDGLRAISVALVLLAHVGLTPGFPETHWGHWAADKCGQFGVKVFFVISGYLITSLLIHELAKTSTISLKDFYIRRAFRIFPAYYAYLGVVLVLEMFSLLSLMPGDIAHAVTYTTNFNFVRSWYVVHTWSLSVEEQFYLLWPAVMLWASPKRRIQIAAATVIFAPIARGVTFYVQRHYGDHTPIIGQTFPTVADSIAVGCLLALLRDRVVAAARYNAFLQSRWFPLVPISLLVMHPFMISLALDHIVLQSLLNIGICVCIDRAVRLPGGAVIRLLNWRPLVYFGTLSYSIYLWQQLCLGPRTPLPLESLPAKVAISLALAWLSFTLIENPFLKLRVRLQKKPAPTPTVAPTAS